MLMSFLFSSRRRHTRCSGVSWAQAEDGIRDAQEARGLGDVYKRQLNVQTEGLEIWKHLLTKWVHGLRAVSYTHLRAHETPEHLVCRLLLEKKKKKKKKKLKKILKYKKEKKNKKKKK